MGVQPPYSKRQHRLWAVSLAACGKIIIGISACLNYCEIFIVYTEFTNVAADCIIQPGGPWVWDLDMELGFRFKTDTTCFIPAECRCELFHKRVFSRLNSWPCIFTLSYLTDVTGKVREMDDPENASQENKVPHATAKCVWAYCRLQIGLLTSSFFILW